MSSIATAIYDTELVFSSTRDDKYPVRRGSCAAGRCRHSRGGQDGDPGLCHQEYRYCILYIRLIPQGTVETT